MEQDVTETVGVTRGQNVVYVLPHDWASIAHFIGPALERLDPAAAELQMLVVTADGDAAAAVTGAATRLADARTLRIVPATSARRAARLLRARPTHIVVGAPAELLSLVQSATLKLDTVRVVVLAWADEILATGAETLETVLAEVPKSAARVLVSSALSPEIEALIERYARRARRVAPQPAEGATALPISYVFTAPGARVGALRRLLDELDPASAAVFVRSDESERIVTDALRGLGLLGEDDALVRVTRTTAGEGAQLVVLFDLPATHQELRDLAGAQPGTIVALAQPRQLATLRALAAGGALTPMTFPDAAVRARGRDEAMREEIRRELQTGAHGRELLALEPLLDEYDGIEVAAVTLRLLERARAERATAVAAAAAAADQVSGTAMTRLFINVGSKDNARPADLVGAIANEAGINRTQIGRVDLRETFSLVDVDAKVASDVVAKLTGIMIRGRRVQARLESDRPPRREHDGLPGRGRDRGPGRPQGSRGPGRRPDRGDRGPRRAADTRMERPPRAARPHDHDV